MGKPVNIYDAKTRLSELVDRAAAGDEIVIAKGRPVARPSPCAPCGKRLAARPHHDRTRLTRRSTRPNFGDFEGTT